MSENENNAQSQQQDRPGRSKSTKAKFSPKLIALIFIAFIAIVFLANKSTPVNWIEDYQSGIDQAIAENKPVLMTIYTDRYGGVFTRKMFDDTYSNKEMTEFIHQNFVPILINSKEQPKIAKKYKFDYDPTHLVILPKSGEVIKSRRGYDTPGTFKTQLIEALEKNKAENK